MSNNDKNDYLPILGNGEKLIESVRKSRSFGDTTYPRSFKESKQRLLEQISIVEKELNDIPNDKKMDEVVLTVRLNEKFLAKSYVPTALFRLANFENIGSRRWLYSNAETNAEKKYSKLHFVKIDPDQLAHFTELLNKDENMLKDNFKEDIRKIEELSLLKQDEVVQGFGDEWKEGHVEFVLHPYGIQNKKMLEKFQEQLVRLGVSPDTIKIKSYDGGPNFVSARVNNSIVQSVADFNPLRTVHPLKLKFFPQIRGSGSDNISVFPPKGAKISQIKVGVFDGGINQSHPFLEKFSKENSSISTHPIVDGINHGTAVAGAVLYGDLNQYEPGTTLNDPILYVESFRVLPLSDPTDFELYEAIDFIENTVPNRNDINVYNLSFGPVGPILDDEISRFTYALDTLAWNYRKLFVIAVGNDGEQPAPFNRIQAPADMVNGLGVGAYTFKYGTGEKMRANYSCVGDGREGCKVKPDLCAFGGDAKHPMRLLNATNPSINWLTAGTSFAAPIVSSKAAEILGRCTRFTPLVARALLIHSAKNPNINTTHDVADNLLGYGILDQEVDDILRCDENTVHIIYSNSMNPTGQAKLPIPLPKNSQINSSVKISWTIATSSKANALHVEDYTESTIEDTFYPNSKRFNFSLPNNSKTKKTLHIENDAEDIQKLINQGYRQSILPVSVSPNKYQTEAARRNELKWDTVVKKHKNSRATSVDNPFLVLQGIGRNDSTDRIDYAVVVTVSIPKHKGNLYEEILNEYRILEPVEIKNRNELFVQL